MHGAESLDEAMLATVRFIFQNECEIRRIFLRNGGNTIMTFHHPAAYELFMFNAVDNAENEATANVKLKSLGCQYDA